MERSCTSLGDDRRVDVSTGVITDTKSRPADTFLSAHRNTRMSVSESLVPLTLLGKFSTGCKTAPGWTLCGRPAPGGPKEDGNTGITAGEVLEGLSDPPMILSMEKGDRCTGEPEDFCTGAAACALAEPRLELSWG
ncbi:hypothetical protein EYF80_028552 [Liparis tanakae]|uniref:Uncharacterized protein n=1 Tax=Liparis tanakae TaxID=230148 RepID=A0A4Z2H5V2_9TELE|nr:hypothetical protein EYF80_028552 [Liparis tanakae]